MDKKPSCTLFKSWAIFGGHISGRRLRGVKINPIFHDPELYYSGVGASAASRHPDVQNQSQIHIDVYESLPRPSRRARLRRLVHSDPDLDIEGSSEVYHSKRTCSYLNRKLGRYSDTTVPNMKDNPETETKKVDTVKYEGMEAGVESFTESKEVNSQRLRTAEDEATATVDSGKESDDIDTAVCGSPTRRLSDSSMIVYEDVDQTSFPMLSSVISHMSSYTDDPSSADVQENVLFYMSDGESPLSDLMYIPSQTPGAAWTGIDNVAIQSDSEEQYLPKVPLPEPLSKPLRPILLSSASNDDSNHTHRSQHLASSEHKTVTFAKDTVFNEDKPKRYQKEKINLKELYHERVCGKTGMGMVNPVFVISDEKLALPETSSDCLTDDEKAKRHSFRISLVSAHPSRTENASFSSDNSSPSSKVPDLNTPAYLQKYLNQARETTLSEITTSGETSASHAAAPNTMPDINDSSDVILELPEDTYGRSERKKLSCRRKTMRWTVFILTMLVLVAGAVGLGVYLSQSSGGDLSEGTTIMSIGIEVMSMSFLPIISELLKLELKIRTTAADYAETQAMDHKNNFVDQMGIDSKFMKEKSCRQS
ncbi:uncharacterized protein [Haliotis asinina]|uniref:uncharacterized protein n=1 Tax=Haliotis asinina TaxID=109174 RepID=UPI003531E921